MGIHAHLVLASEPVAQRAGILLYGIENATLPPHPALFHAAEKAVKQLARNHFGGQRTVALSPTHVPLNAFAERFLRHADLQRAETRFAAQARRDHLIERRSPGAASGKLRSAH